MRAFSSCAARQELNDEKPFKNPRNAAAGSLRQKDAADHREHGPWTSLFSMSSRSRGKSCIPTSESLRLFEGARLPGAALLQRLSVPWQEVIEEVRRIGELRGSLGYSIDGAVVKVDDFSQRRLLGQHGEIPKMGGGL